MLYYLPFSFGLVVATILFTRHYDWHRRKRLVASAVILAAVTLAAGAIRQFPVPVVSEIVYYPVYAAVIIVLARWSFGCSWLESLITVTSGYATQHIAFALLQACGLMDFGSLTVSGIILHVTVLVGVYAAFAFVGRRFPINGETIRNAPARVLVSFVVLLLVTQCNIIIVEMTASGLLSDAGARLCHLYDAFCSTLAFTILVMASSIDSLANDLAVIKQVDALKERHYEISRENIELVNTKFHDIRKQLASLRRLVYGLRQSQETDPEDADGSHDVIPIPVPVQAIEQMENSIRVYDSIFDTGDDALDTLLTEKSLYCTAHDITLTVMADGSAIAFMDRSDIYSLFGNILDNAIEAVTLLPDSDDRQITFTLHVNGRLLRIEEENYYAGDVRLDEDGLPVTTKGDRRFRGFGMKSIRRQVAKYHGEMTIDTTDHIFSLSIIIPMPKQ